jgi:glucokinase
MCAERVAISWASSSVMFILNTIHLYSFYCKRFFRENVNNVGGFPRSYPQLAPRLQRSVSMWYKRISEVRMLLAGDIGGTKTALALYEKSSNPANPLVQETFQSSRYDSLEAIIRKFLQSHDQYRVELAVFGVAGPVVAGKSALPNLPWVIEESNLLNTFNFETTKVINDLEAIGHAVPVLEDRDLATVKVGEPVPYGNIAVVAPGTGLGETFLNWHGDRYIVHPSEGGHADFAPVDEFQTGLLDYLLDRFDHVSCERVCSGTGIPNIYAYIKEAELAEEPEWLARELEDADDPNAVIFGNAADERQACRICTLTAETFVSILAAEAGNMVLRCMATGGMFLGGGIPPRILSLLRRPNFQHWFTRKGRLSHLPERTPVKVIMHRRTALVGAASFAFQLADKPDSLRRQ